LLDPQKQREDFETIGSFGSKNSVTLKLKNPARKAATVKEIAGTLELFVPKLDPDSTVAIEEFQKKTGARFEAPALEKSKVKVIAWNKAQFAALQEKKKAADAKKPKGISEALGSAFSGIFGIGNMNDNDFALQVEDPDSKVVEIEFQDAAGKRLETNGRSSSGGNELKTMFYNLRNKLPENAKLVIYLATPKALVKVPVALKDVPLP
jgi:hypothetical protein